MSDVKAPQPGFSSDTIGANVVPDMTATAYLLSY